MSKDKLRKDIWRVLLHLVVRDYDAINAEEATDQIIVLFPDIEELEKQVRQLKQSDFAEMAYSSEFRKVQLDGGQFVYENILRLIRKMEGGEMKAKDTVMSDEQLLKLGIIFPERMSVAKECALKAQAEITWDKAIREAVEWLMENNSTPFNSYYGIKILKEEWQAKLKEWEIK